MSTEEFNQTPKAEKPAEETFGEQLALENLEEIAAEIQAAVAKNAEHNVDGHWSAAVTRLSIAFGNQDVVSLMEKRGWTKDVFPDEF